MKFYKSKDYWYGVWQSTARPFVAEKVASTDKKWDDHLLEAFDYIFERLCGPDEEQDG